MDDQATKRGLKNIEIAGGLYSIAYQTKSYQLKKSNPQLSNEQIHEQTVNWLRKSCEKQ